MRRLLSIVLLTVAWSKDACCEEAPRPPVKFTVADGDAIVFLGDSITQQGLYTQYVETYFYTRDPGLRLKFHNAGVSGDTAADALARFDRDVASYRPRYVTVLLGMNDGSSTKFDESLFDTYRADMQQLVERIRKIGATPILLTPTMYDSRMAARRTKPDSRGRGGYYNGVLALYGAWLREAAAANGAGFADLYGPLNYFTNQSRKSDPDFTLIPDGIHPDPNGQIVMAYSLVADLGLSKRVFTIDISRNSADEVVTKTAGGKITEASTANGGYAFTFAPECLTLPVPAGAEMGAKLIPLGHRLGLEALYVHGLSAGRYELWINDQRIGVFASQQLESKLELQNFPTTPQYQQALQVARLNAQRNEQAVLPLRDLWRAKKSLAKTERELEASPDDATLKKRAFVQQRNLADFDEQLAGFERTARQIEDEIYRANQPQPLHFRILPAAGKQH
ncbi:MAG TPA: SGNH/GDSL hydrolase family protein [Pirellulales bacterium]|nr:SGNH/GDSL hydrolase family protein [Pirellulales bacterium]